MLRNKNVIILIISLGLLFGCNIVKGLRLMNNEKVKTKYYSFKEKEIIFVPIVHFGQKVFYNSLKDSVIRWKANGYTIFYEEIHGEIEKETDSIRKKELVLKYRKLFDGITPSREFYEKELIQVFKNGMIQPYYDFFTIDSTDINADVSDIMMIEETERRFGRIVLTDCDYNTPIDSTYQCESMWKKESNLVILLDYRNEYVVDQIMQSEKKKIVVLYGENHIKGMMKLLDEHK